MGIPFFRWPQRFVCKLTSLWREDDWAFRRPDGTRALALLYRDDVFRKLRVIQATTLMIEPGYKIWDV